MQKVSVTLQSRVSVPILITFGKNSTKISVFQASWLFILILMHKDCWEMFLRTERFYYVALLQVCFFKLEPLVQCFVFIPSVSNSKWLLTTHSLDTLFLYKNVVYKNIKAQKCWNLRIKAQASSRLQKDCCVYLNILVSETNVIHSTGYTPNATFNVLI